MYSKKRGNFSIINKVRNLGSLPGKYCDLSANDNNYLEMRYNHARIVYQEDLNHHYIM